jgi:hypothetical protein
MQNEMIKNISQRHKFGRIFFSGGLQVPYCYKYKYFFAVDLVWSASLQDIVERSSFSVSEAQ